MEETVFGAALVFSGAVANARRLDNNAKRRDVRSPSGLSERTMFAFLGRYLHPVSVRSRRVYYAHGDKERDFLLRLPLCLALPF